MTRGYQPQPIKEYAGLMSVAQVVALWQKYEAETARVIRREIAGGVRAEEIAKHLGWSRSTLYRWLAQHPPTQ